MTRTHRNICAICGINTATTLDHLPPKSIFPRPRPNNLITVPSCKECNQNASILDEAFRLYLALHVVRQGDEATKKYFQEALKTFEHNGRLQREIINNSQPIDCTTESGIYLGQGMKVTWNSTAHDAVIERIVRGLYYHHFGEVLPPQAKVFPKWFSEPNEEFLQTMNDLTKNIIGNNQFVYFYGRSENDPTKSVWYFEFYGQHWAGAHTGMD